MTRPRIENSITVGNILQIAVIVASVSGVIYVGNYRLGASEEELIAVQSDMAQLQDRVRELETFTARQDERLGAILGTLGRIEAAVEDLRRQ